MNLDGWIIAPALGRTVIGKPSGFINDCPSFLQPAYELQAGFLPTGDRGKVMPACIAMPLLGPLCVSGVRLAREGSFVLVSDLEDHAKRMLEQAVEHADDVAVAMRAQRSGLSLSRELPNGVTRG